ncbi:MAG: hypothetical protein U0105_16390 [Candidatus Obscuribacterales bacterium]
MPNSNWKCISLKSSALVGAVVTAAVVLAFLLPWWNHFLGMRSGNDYTAASWMLQGILPYRDYFLCAGPMETMKGAALLAMFGQGHALIVPRVFGLIERLVLAVVIFVWLQRLVKTPYAVLGAILATVLSSSEAHEPIDSYQHTTALMAIVSALAASYSLDKERSTRALWLLALLSGASAGLCLITKQSLGVGASVTIPAFMACCFFRSQRAARALSFFGGFTLGWLLSAGLFAAVLIKLSLLQAYFEQVYIRAPAAKASSPIDFFTHAWILVCEWSETYIVALVITIAAFLVWWRAVQPARAEIAKTAVDKIVTLRNLLIAGCAAVVAATLTHHLMGEPAVVVAAIAALFLRMITCVTGYGILIVSAILAYQFFKAPPSPETNQKALCAVVSLMMAFMMFLSFPLYHFLDIPALGLVVALLLDGAPPLRMSMFILYCLVLFLSTFFKIHIPYAFETYFEPQAESADYESKLPELKGFLLPKESVEMIDETVQIVKANSTEHDTIFVYPELAMIYGLSHRRPPTASATHNMDVITDKFAQEEAQRLLANPPKVLVYRALPDAHVRRLEHFWRHDQRSGHRDLMEACDKLAREYRLVKSFPVRSVGDTQNMNLNIYVRPDAIAP